MCYNDRMQPYFPRRILPLVAMIGCLVPLLAKGAILRNLKTGDRGADVRELQIVLNKNPETKIAATGPGSPGNETDYFGSLTQNAVMRLQQKYASDVLTPVGLAAPTGVVGSQTRLLLLRLSGSGSVPVVKQALLGTAPLTAGQGVKTTGASLQPKILSISPAVVTKSTEDITIIGTGFSATGNTVLVSSERPGAFANLSSSDGKTIRFVFHFTAADKLKQQARASGNYDAVAAALAENIKERVSGSATVRIPVIVLVRNAGGDSKPVQLLVDVSAILNDNAS